MKHSIKKIFLNLNTYLFFVLFVSFVGTALTLEHHLTFEKVSNLNGQKRIISTLTKLEKDDIELALIQFNGKSTQLLQETDKLRSMYKYNYTDRFIFNNSEEYLNDLSELSKQTKEFNEAAHAFYVDTKDKDSEILAETNLKNAFYKINRHIDNILLKNIDYAQEKFNIIEKLVIVIFVLILLATLWYRKQLFSIYKDIEYLYQIDKNKFDYEIYSREADAISLRMNRKAVVSNNPTMLDPVTEINNYKGMINSYSEKKHLKDSNYTSLTVLEINNFSKSKRTYSQEHIQTILKKVAYAISLHQQPVDVIARTDYNEFTIILSRASREASFKDMDIIRQSIEELKITLPDHGPISITVCGGFVIKPNNTNIEEAIRQAKEILQYGKSIASTKILQLRDMAERHL